jgi:RNA polymerase sigma-70 factor (ECF subfamily)
MALAFSPARAYASPTGSRVSPSSLSSPSLAAPLGLWWMAALGSTPLPRAEAERRFAAVVASAGDAIWRLCRFRERDAERRRDLYQEIALAIWQALPGFRADASERTWALRIAHNVAATHVGRAVRERRLTPVGDDDGRLDAAAAVAGVVLAAGAEQRLDLLARLAALDLPSQQLVLLQLEGLSTREIADVTGLTPTNVTTRLNRLRARLSARARSDGGLEPERGRDPTEHDVIAREVQP